MDCFDTCYVLNRKLFLLVGLWPKNKSKNVLLKTYFINLIFFSGYFHQVAQFYLMDLNLDSIVEWLYMVLPVICVSTSYYTVLFSPLKIAKIVDRIERDWKELTNKHESLIMEKYSYETKICTIFLISIFYAFEICFISPSLLRIVVYNFDSGNDTVLTLPVQSRHFTHGSMMYYILFLHQIISLFIGVTIAIAIYANLLTCVQHACTLFAIIKSRLNRPFQKNGDYCLHSDAVKESYDWVVDVTKRYAEAIKFVDLVNSLTENAYLIEVFVLVILFSIDFLYLFQISTLMNNVFESLAIMVYIVGSMLILYMNCYVGQRLMDHSMQVLHTSSHVPFYDIPQICHKPLQLMIMRGMKPCKLSIGGIFAPSHNFFSLLIQKSYSYAMVCYTMR